MDITAVVSQGDSTTGCSHTVATTQSDTGGNELRAFHSLGGSISQDDHEDSFFAALFDAAENCEKSQPSSASSTRVEQTEAAESLSAELETSTGGEVPASFTPSPRSIAQDSSGDAGQERQAHEELATAENEEMAESSSPSHRTRCSPSSEKESHTYMSISPLNEALQPQGPKVQPSLPNIPVRPTRPLSKTKALLSRPFGRSSLPPEIIRKWVVEVSPAEWDADESQWKYRLLIQSRHMSLNKERKKNPVFPFQQSFTTAFTWRSIADFFWLEESLQHEYQGGLLLPDLSKALRGPIKGNIRETPVEAEKLRNWLSDVLNGVRGQGELVMDYEAEGILGSESMEAFLYRSSGPTSLSRTPDQKSPISIRSPGQKKDKCPSSASFIEHLFSPSIMLSPFAACAGSSFDTHGDLSTRRRAGLMKQIDAISCQSSALVLDRSFDRQDSFLEGEPVIRECPTFYSMFIEAEQDLIMNYRATAHRATERLNILIDEEEKAGYAWSIFIQSLVLLFSFEKESEIAHIADLKLRPENMPFRRLDRNVVNESLESFTKAKVDRAIPSLSAFGAMLRAFVDDLESIESACNAFHDARAEIMNKADTDNHPKSLTWEDKIKDLACRSFAPQESQERRLELQLQREVEKNRLLKNEKLLYKSLTTFCRGVPIRSSRMAWRYLNTEASQCAALHAASAELRKNVTKMVSRQIQHEREDFEVESSLVKKILDLTPKGSSSHESERILRIAQVSGGKWDLTLAEVILREVGVVDSAIQMKELTRDLEMIRKYACDLRENLDRCTGSLHQLRKACVGGRRLNKSSGTLEAARDAFLTELANLFSGSFINVDNRYAEQRKEILSQAGVDTSDPFKWKRLCSSSTFTQGSAASMVNAYFIECDSRTEWVLDQMSQLLQEYTKQVDATEGFVYMNYVELNWKVFFKSKRADMLVAFEKKTDVKAAINVAMKKRMPHLVSELQVKLDGFGPDVSQTKMKEIKAAHLASKEIKSGLHELAMKRLIHSREASTEKETESTSTQELKALGEAMNALEKSVDKEDFFETVVYRLSKKTLNSEMV